MSPSIETVSIALTIALPEIRVSDIKLFIKTEHHYVDINSVYISALPDSKIILHGNCDVLSADGTVSLKNFREPPVSV
jgi:hypothetical protein